MRLANAAQGCEARCQRDGERDGRDNGDGESAERRDGGTEREKGHFGLVGFGEARLWKAATVNQ